MGIIIILYGKSRDFKETWTIEEKGSDGYIEVLKSTENVTLIGNSDGTITVPYDISSQSTPYRVTITVSTSATGSVTGVCAVNP